MSTDGEVFERPGSPAVDDPAPPGSGMDGEGPPGSARGGGDAQCPGPAGDGPRHLLVLLLSVLLSTAASGVSTSADLPWWAHILLLSVGAVGIYFLWKPKSIRLKRVAVALAVAIGSATLGITGARIIQNWRCSEAVGRGLDPASTKAFETAYSRGGRERFGCPKGDAFVREGGSFQMFSGGRAGPGVMAGEPKEPPVPVFGGLWRAYEAIGDGVRNAASWAGIPTESTREGTARVVYLSDGKCGEGGLYRPRRGVVYWVMADLYEEYVSRGGHLGFLGFPVSDPVIKGRRVKQKFDGGVVHVKVRELRTCYSLT